MPLFLTTTTLSSISNIFKSRRDTSCPALPVELWLYIIRFIPARDIFKLVAVNRVFFEVVMSELYSQLSFISAEPRIFYEKLTTLQNPCFSERIRVLTVWPSAVRDAINAIEHDRSRPPGQPDVPERSRTPTPRFKHVRYLSRGREYVEELLGHHKPQPQPAPALGGKEPLPSPEERTEMFKESIRRLTRVEEFELNWYIDQGKDEHAWKFALFPYIWQGIGQHLRRLAIDIQLAKMGDAVTSCVSLPRLETLDLTLRCYPGRSDLYASGQYGGDTIVPYFINKFAPTLQQLSMKTIGHQELSQTFQLLGVFPRLTKLSIVMPLDNYHLQDPAGFRALLRNHPQLRELCIRYTRCCRDCIQDGFDSYEGKHKLYGDVNLPALRSLELGLHIPIPQGIMNNALYHHVVRRVGSTNTLYYNIAQMGSELTSLSLTDRNLSLEEVKTLLGLFPSYRLKKLSFFAKVLSPRLIDAIAQACPSLSSLSLDVETVSSQDPCAETYLNPDVEGFAKALYNYGVDLHHDRWRYRTWTLSDVSVMRWELKIGHQYNWACMQAIAAVVPSVRSFAGRGHMQPDNELKVGGVARGWDGGLGLGGQRLVELDGRTRPLDT